MKALNKLKKKKRRTKYKKQKKREVTKNRRLLSSGGCLFIIPFTFVLLHISKALDIYSPKKKALDILFNFIPNSPLIFIN